MKKFSIRVVILTGWERHFWINPGLFAACLGMGQWAQQRPGTRLSINTVHGMTPVDAARNVAVRQFLQGSDEWLLQIDNDVVPSNVLAALDDIGDRKIVGFPYAIQHTVGQLALAIGTKRGEPFLYESHRSIPPHWSHFDGVGTGCFLVHRDVFNAISDPWFECRRESIAEGMHTGEDFDFCEKARARGFLVWTNADFPCFHYRTMELTQATYAIPEALRNYHQALCTSLGMKVPLPSELL